MDQDPRDPKETEFAPLRQLVSFWRDRAERLRAQAAGSHRAEVFDACAAQLSEAIAALQGERAGTPDADLLTLFRDPGGR